MFDTFNAWQSLLAKVCAELSINFFEFSVIYSGRTFAIYLVENSVRNW